MEIPETALTRAFFERPPELVARELLGCRLVSGQRVGTIVETEAYAGSTDGASHSYRGPTPRNRVMFERPGIAYVYFVYGCHHCFNVVAHRPDEVGAVLVRAVEPWGKGPGLLCRALEIDRSHTGTDLCVPGALFVAPGERSGAIESGTRVGITRSVELPWRFWLRGNRWVSGGARSKAVESGGAKSHREPNA